MIFKAAVVGMLVVVVGSLLSGLVFLLRDRGEGPRVVRALTMRIALSLLLFVTLLAGGKLGLIGG